MQNHVLSSGTVLDDRYRIESVLGQGGFGITYSAVNVRLDLKVAVKELFWREHSVRDALSSPQVTLYDPDDGQTFEELKERFLREARTIRDFSDEEGIAHVLDYFEANGTAYIVMEYVNGVTLRTKLQESGPMPVEDTLRSFLPLIRSLDRIHSSGIIHRDISPDNVMARSDGSMKLIDFGAAKSYAAAKQRKSRIVTKEGFAPAEQYDKNGEQGPWTDVYSLCATLYNCITGIVPDSAMQRMFLDELKTPSDAGAATDPKYEAIIMKGLELKAKNRFQSMKELEKAISAALPADEAVRRRKGLWIVAAAVILCLGAALGITIFQLKNPADKFKGIKTETFYLTAPSDVTAKRFAECRDKVESALSEFAGADNYEITPNGTRFEVRLPLACFNGNEIGTVLNGLFGTLLKEEQFGYSYQIQPVWEDPEASTIAGEHQIRADAFDTETAVFTYRGSEKPTKGQRANLIVDIKTRLDALDTPYAFGTVYGDDDEMVFRIDPKCMGRFVTETIGSMSSLKIAGECGHANAVRVFKNSVSHEFFIRTYEDGTLGVCYRENDPEDLKKLTELALEEGWNKLYLENGEGTAIAEAEIAAPIENGEIEFRTFRIEGFETVDEEHRYVVDYLNALVNETYLPMSVYKQGEGIWGPEGDLLFDVPVEDRLGWRIPYKDSEKALRNVLHQIREEKGYAVGKIEGRKVYYILLGLETDAGLIDNVSAIVPQLLKEYSLSAYAADASLFIVPVEESTGELFRITLHTGWDYTKKEIYHYADWLMSERGRFAPYAESFKQWWDAFPSEEYGFEKNYRF